MTSKTIVVVGGVAAGMSFATRYRRLNQNDHIIILEKGPYVSFANCGLPYYVSNEIDHREDLIVASKDMLVSRFDLDIRENHEVMSINSQNKSVSVKNQTKLFDLPYDTLILAPGAKPFKLNISGMDQHPGVFTLRNIPDVDQIVEYIQANEPKNAVVIGAGFIGLEMAESLKHRGLNVSIVEKAPHVLPPFDSEMATYATTELKRNDIRLYTNNEVIEFKHNKAILQSGDVIDADLVIMSIGVIPETAFTNGSGIELGMRNGFIVDDNYQTSVKDIYAIGDAAIIKHTITKQETMIPLASPANRQGRQLADILSGINHKSKGSLGTAIVRLFDLTFASTGLNERALKQDDIYIMHLSGNDHAGYFPNAAPIRLKVIFDKNTHLILGAQAVGQKGVDKRIDVIATAIKAQMKVDELQELELSYAPPFGSAKDIVNMAGYVGQNLILETTQTIQWHQLSAIDYDSTILLDVRTPEEYRDSTPIGSAIHIPLDNLRSSLDILPKDQNIIVYCQSGVRSYNAERILRDKGFKVENLDGSYLLYSQIKKEGLINV